MSAIALITPPLVYRFSRFDRLTLKDVPYTCYQSDSHGHQFQRKDGTNICETFTHGQIEELVRTGELKIDRHYYSPQVVQVRNTTGGVEWEDLTDKEKSEIAWRKFYCDEFLRMEKAHSWVNRSEKPMTQVILQIAAMLLQQSRSAKGATICGQIESNRVPPTYTTLLRWVNPYEQSGFDKMALMPGRRRSGNTTDRLHAEINRLMTEKARSFLDRRQPSVTAAYRELKTAIDQKNAEHPALNLEVPSIRSLYRLVEKLDPFHAVAARSGIDVAKKLYLVTTTGLQVVRPFERLETDEWKVHLHTLLERSPDWLRLSDAERKAVARIRCSLVSINDAATRCVAGAVLTPGPSTTTDVKRALQMVVTDKTAMAQKFGCQTPWNVHGRPELVVHDAGSIYTSEDTRLAIISIGAHGETAPAGVPELRSRIERSFRTIDQGLMYNFTGRTFSDVEARGTYNSEANASLTFHELHKAMIRWIVDIYHNSPHEGLNGETPYNAWLRLNREYGVEPIPTVDNARLVFGTTLRRRIGGRGIRFMGMFYQSEAVQLIRRETGQKSTMIRVDQGDMGNISVKGQRGWITVPVIKSNLDGVPVSTWVAARLALRNKHLDDAALAWPIVSQALQDIRAMGDDAITAAGLDSPVVSDEQLNKYDRDLFRTFRFSDGSRSESWEPAEYEVGDDAASAEEEIPYLTSDPSTDKSAKRTRTPKTSGRSRSDSVSTAGDESEWSVD